MRHYHLLCHVDRARVAWVRSFARFDLERLAEKLGVTLRLELVDSVGLLVVCILVLGVDLTSRDRVVRVRHRNVAAEEVERLRTSCHTEIFISLNSESK